MWPKWSVGCLKVRSFQNSDITHDIAVECSIIPYHDYSQQGTARWLGNLCNRNSEALGLLFHLKCSGDGRVLLDGNVCCLYHAGLHSVEHIWPNCRKVAQDWIIVLTGWQLFIQYPSPTTFLAALLLISWGQRGLSTLAHDSIHRNLFRSRVRAVILYDALSYTNWVAFPGSKWLRCEHCTGTAEYEHRQIAAVISHRTPSIPRNHQRSWPRQPQWNQPAPLPRKPRPFGDSIRLLTIAERRVRAQIYHIALFIWCFGLPAVYTERIGKPKRSALIPHGMVDSGLYTHDVLGAHGLSMDNQWPLSLEHLLPAFPYIPLYYQPWVLRSTWDHWPLRPSSDRRARGITTLPPSQPERIQKSNTSTVHAFQSLGLLVPKVPTATRRQLPPAAPSAPEDSHEQAPRGQ